MNRWTDMALGFSHLIFPQLCPGCGSDLLTRKEVICLSCFSQLPLTGFEHYPGNPLEKIFWGRAEIQAAAALCYFSRDSALQQMIHRLKYHGHKEMGLFLGALLGRALKISGRFDEVQALVPLPLHASREKKRGYNQSELICKGMAPVMDLPILSKAIARRSASETQTRKDRMQRWLNMKERFEVADEEAIRGRHLLLVDDIVTTGATLDACANTFLMAEKVKISLAALAFTMI